jgi:WD40 repeat protein/transcriptional regulator with XRE-family HTH domain
MEAEPFRGLLLRHRGRTGLTQRDLAARAGVHMRSVQLWEAGVSYPTADRLQALIRALLEMFSLTPGHEMSEARALWSAVEREASRMHTPFDEDWFAMLLAKYAPPGPAGSRLAISTTEVRADVEPLQRREMASADTDEGPTSERAQDWGEAPDTLTFVGRVEERALLQRWVLEERCRLVAVLGMGGIGKTSLSAWVAQSLADSFERVYWRSLRNAPPVNEWMSGAIGFLSDQQWVPPVSELEQLSTLLKLLRTKRCLLVLDNSETLFEPGQREVRYRAGMEEYGRLLLAVGERAHQSCLLLTSREAPPELALLGGEARTLELHGLGTSDAQACLADKQLSGDARAWTSLVELYGGNGLALKIVGETIRQVFDGNVGAFLTDAIDTYGTVFGGIRRLLEAQVERLSPVEHDLLTRLAIEREPVSLTELSRNFAPSVDRSTLIEAVETLRRRSLVERGERVATFTLQSMVLEYMTERLISNVADEIRLGPQVLMVEQPLIKAQAKDYVRQTQERLIGVPILQQLKPTHDKSGTEQILLTLLDSWRDRPRGVQGYAPGNLINLLRLLRGDLRGLDLSQLSIRQGYLAQVDAQDASLMNAHLAESVLAQAFDFAGSVALSGDGALLAAGTSTGQLWLWRVADRAPLLVVEGHTSGVWSLALSGNSQLVASGGGDGMARLWESSTGRQLARFEGHTGTVSGVGLSADGHLLASGDTNGTLQVWETTSQRLLATMRGHTGGVWGVALSADGHLVASCGGDGSVRLWEASTGRPLNVLAGHTGTVWNVALSGDCQLVASGATDGTVRIWQVSDGHPLATLRGHNGNVAGVALSADGQLVASGGADGSVRLWSVDRLQMSGEAGAPLAILQGHTGAIWRVALSDDGQLVASGGGDGSVRLWETRTLRPLAILQGQSYAVWGVTVSPDGQLLASGHTDGSVRLWRASTGHSFSVLQGHTGGVWSVALSADARLLASGGADQSVQLWDTATGQRLSIMRGHVATVWRVALSADGRLLTSCGEDGTVRLWDTTTGHPLAVLLGHTGTVFGVALSADGRLMASGGTDGTVRLWDTATARELAVLQGHTGGVWSVALSANGSLVASGGGDGTVRLWETNTGRPRATLLGHTGAVPVVALSADAQLLASAGTDGTLRLWETGSDKPLATVRGHTGGVWGLALSADGQLVASGSFDGTVKLWERTGAPVRTLRVERRYERMNITGTTGITDAQRAALLALGAAETPNHQSALLSPSQATR